MVNTQLKQQRTIPDLESSMTESLIRNILMDLSSMSAEPDGIP